MKNKVLFVDDEVLILNSLKRGLMDEEYQVFFANSGEEALKIMEKDEISVLVTDMKMPVMTGLDLLKESKKLYPQMVKIVLSGYTQLPQVLVTVNQGDIFRFITKPWDLENEFKYIIREAVDYYNYRIELLKSRESLEKKNITFQSILKSYDDKLLAIKNEVVLMRKLNIILFKEQNKMFNNWDEKSGRKELLLEKMINLETMVLELFNLIPFFVKRFSAKVIIEDIKRLTREKRTLRKYDLKLDSKITSLKGKYDLLLFLIMKINEFIFVESVDTLVQVAVSTEIENEDDVWLKVLFQVDEKYLQKGKIQDVMLNLIQEIGKSQSIFIQVVSAQERRIFILKMLFSR